MRRALVTGGAGFIGSNLVSRLVREGYSVVVLDDFSSGLRSNLKNLNCEIVVGSLTNKNLVFQCMEGAELVFHLGARGSVPRSVKSPLKTFSTNVVGTLNVLESARSFKSKVIFSSSSSIYGANTELPKTEKSWASPLSPYAASKLSGEALALSYSSSYNIEVVILRFFNVYGPFQRPDHEYAAVIPKWLWKSMQGESIHIFGDGNQLRDFTYVGDVVESLIRVARKEFRLQTPINVAFGKPISLNMLVKEIERISGRLKVIYDVEREGDVRHSTNDPMMFFDVLGKVPYTEISVGIQNTYEWLKNRNA